MYKRLAKIRGQEEGFTLVELLIVVAIIAILAAIAIPQFSKYKKRAYVATLNADIKNAYTAASVYLTDDPAATINSITKLNTGGYTPSSGVSWGSGNMTLDGGLILLSSTFPIDGPTSSVTYEGVITKAYDN